MTAGSLVDGARISGFCVAHSSAALMRLGLEVSGWIEVAQVGEWMAGLLTPAVVVMSSHMGTY